MKPTFLPGGIVIFCCFITLQINAATHVLTLNTNGPGSVAANPSFPSYPHGSTITLTATAATNSHFVSWSGGLNATTNPANLLMDDDKVVTANFAIIPSYNLTVNPSGSGSVTPSSGTYLSNTTVFLSATAADGWIFANWSGDAGGNVNPLSVTMNGQKVVGANFAQPPGITTQPTDVTASPGDTVAFTASVTGSGPLSYDWRFNGASVSSENTLTLTNIQPFNGGGYHLIVSSAYGSVTSRIANLIVNCSGTNVVSVSADAALRSAMAVGGVVRFCVSGTIVLTNVIDVTRDVVLDGQGVSVTLSGNNAVRLFNVGLGVTLTVSNIALVNGYNIGATDSTGGYPANAGAIYNYGNLVLAGCLLSNNVAQGGNPAGTGNGGDATGGAIVNNGGTVSLYSVQAISNRVLGGVLSGQTGLAGLGIGGFAANLSNGVILATNCSFTGNRAHSSNKAQGGGLANLAGNVFIDQCILSGNTTEGGPATGVGTTPLSQSGSAYGGALFNASGSLRVGTTTISGNSAVGGLGFRGNWGGAALGGGVYSAGSLTIEASVFADNLARTGDDANPDARGGGLCTDGTAVVSRVTLSGNTARGGNGGIWATPSGWPAANGLGGGVFNGGTLYITNATLTSNTAMGGVCTGDRDFNSRFGLGGGVFNTGTVVAVNVTIASNATASANTTWAMVSPPAAGANLASTNGTFELRNSIIAYPVTNLNVLGAITDSGFNICSDGSANFNGGASFNLTDPVLLPLANNGGPTLTMALSANSPAIDFGLAAGAPSTDQRGFPRPYGSGGDIGAYEAGPTVPKLSYACTAGIHRVTFPVPAMAYALQRSTDLITWHTVPTSVTSGVISSDVPPGSNVFYRLHCWW